MKKEIIFTPIKTKTKSVKLAEYFLDSVCATMKTRAHAFIPVLQKLDFVPVKEEVDICTNGEVVFYNPKQIIQMAKTKCVDVVERKLFHIIFHGMLGHFEETQWKRKKLAWAVQDIQVHRYMKMIYQESYGRDEAEELLNDYIGDELYFKGAKDKAFRKKVKKIAEDCWFENHAVWSYSYKKGKMVEGVDEQELRESQKKFWQEARECVYGEAGKKGNEEKDGKEGQGIGEASLISEEEKAKVLSYLLEKEVSKKYGHLGAQLKNEVEYRYESSNSYRELLEKITRLSEVVYEEQELDKVLYSYGLSLYGDVPLVEPEEISEKHCLHTIVVAVDTSGSCTHRAELFFREIVAVFEEIKKIGRLEHVCYLECDTEITTQKDCESIEEFIEFGKKHTFVGGGGTCFAPVFAHADKLAAEGETVDAVIYITDGWGEFPDYEDSPPYEVFLLLDIEEEWEMEGLCLPDWAEGIVMHQTEHH